jgi:hypothetical protein
MKQLDLCVYFPSSRFWAGFLDTVIFLRVCFVSPKKESRCLLHHTRYESLFAILREGTQLSCKTSIATSL